MSVTCAVMPRESRAAKDERANRIFGTLRRTYPEAHCELNFSNPLELLIATILSAQCTDKQVNIVTEALFRKYRTARIMRRRTIRNFERKSSESD